MIDVAPGYLSCIIQQLTKSTENLIAMFIKFLCSPAAHNPKASPAAEPTVSAEGSCASESAPRLSGRRPWCSTYRALPCCRQLAAGVSCGSGTQISVRTGLLKKFTGGHEEQMLESHRYLNDCLQSFGLDNAWRQNGLPLPATEAL